MGECPHPIHGHGCVTLAGDVFGKKNITRAEHSPGAVANPDLDRSRKRDTPLPARRGVPAVQIVAIGVVLEHQCFDRKRRQKMLRSCGLI